MVSISLFLRIGMAYKPVLAKKFIYKHQYPKYRLFVYRVKVCDVYLSFSEKFQSCFVWKVSMFYSKLKKSPSYFKKCFYVQVHVIF